ncbi:MAG: HD-GYP domain-containing protein [Lachnospiraceae bacterium]|nr:HD-GYP domain-containing protein [Lachnospiraceae bacterium]
MEERMRQAEYRSIIEESLKTFANIIDAKDKYTNGHSMRVAVYSRELAKKLDLSEEEQERIYYIALMHDIGKVGVADGILNKPGKLTPEEQEVIRNHPRIGGEILKDFKSLPGISDGARYHHERYDGTGYNEGLKGEEIPFYARIICVADSYDAMAADRCYSRGMDAEAIKKEIINNMGTQFDPKIAELMLELMEEGKVPV